MTGEEAVRIAQRTTEHQGLPWLLPVVVRRIEADRRRVTRHSGNRGLNIRMLIRDCDGLVEEKQFAFVTADGTAGTLCIQDT